MKRTLPLLGLWVVAATALATIGSRVADWYSMTDEMRYERLAIAIAETRSLVPRIHGVDIKSYSQLYPMLIAPLFRHGLVTDDLRHAHELNAVLMTSACIPAYLLARRATGRQWAAYVVAVLSVVTPWMVYGTMLLTEVAAYPVFLWALYAVERTVAAPTRRNDLLALATLALAYFARTSLVVLVLVLPAAVVAYELARGRRALRAALHTHLVLVAGYAVLFAASLVLLATGRFSSIFGVYGYYAQNQTLLAGGLAGSLAEHVATFALALGILPFLVGAAWLFVGIVRPPERPDAHAFACVGAICLGAIIVQSTVFDVRYTGFVHDRFLLYLVPVVLTGVLCAAVGRRPLWSLFVAAGVVALGFGFGALPGMTWDDPKSRFLPDAPAAILYRPLMHVSHGLTNARLTLLLATLALAVLFVEASVLLPPRLVAASLTVFSLVAVPAASAFVFAHYLAAPSWSNRPLTNPDGRQLTWVDRAVGRHARVALVPYPVSSDYFVSQEGWRDLEFWNASVVRDVHWPASGAFAYTGFWFPKLYPSFDLRTGATSVAGIPYALESDNETRFGLAGKTVAGSQAFVLVDAGEPWRLAWVSFDLTDDGWTKPGVTARIRVFPARNQPRAQTRYLTFIMRPPGGVPSRRVKIVSNLATWRGKAAETAVIATVKVCVPARGYAEVRLRANGASPIPGDQDDPADASVPRNGGVSVRAINLSDEVRGPCTPRR